MLILGSLTAEQLPSAPGHIRAYDTRSGKIRWTFHTIPQPGEFGYDTWPKDAWKYTGAANNWSGMSVDEKRGLVFVPTGSAAFDFYGANRAGDNLFANSIVCLRAATGERVWHFQGVKHDVWDRDFPAPPSLITIRRNGRSVDVVAQKMGTPKEQELCLHGLKHAAGFVQSKLAGRLKTRFTPQIQFVLDQGVKNSIEMSRLIKEALAQPGGAEATPAEGEGPAEQPSSAEGVADD